MSRSQLEQSLAALRSELAALGSEADDVKRRLGVLADDIEKQLDSLEAAADDEDASLLAQTRHQIEVFEVEHPRLTTILNDIMVTLSNLGI